jgi:hypothetical protein
MYYAQSLKLSIIIIIFFYIVNMKKIAFKLNNLLFIVSRWFSDEPFVIAVQSIAIYIEK